MLAIETDTDKVLPISEKPYRKLHGLSRPHARPAAMHAAPFHQCALLDAIALTQHSPAIILSIAFLSKT
jgi:hypothetical protein